MTKDILLISDSENGFTARAIQQSFEKIEFKVINISFEAKDLFEKLSAAKQILIQGGEELEEYIPVLRDIKLKCALEKKKVILYGSKNEISDMKRIFPLSLIAGELIRPMDSHEVVEQVIHILLKEDKLQRQKKILVVDDSGIMLRTIMGWLEDSYQVFLANSAANAFNMIPRNKPDLILLDYEMPVCSGAQFFEMLRSAEDTKDIPVIFLTARGDAETVKSVIALKPEGYLLKTSSGDKVVEKVNEFFETSKED